jgi:hypothetical protein
MKISPNIACFYQFWQGIFCSGFNFSSVFPKFRWDVGKAKFFINLFFAAACNLFSGFF